MSPDIDDIAIAAHGSHDVVAFSAAGVGIGASVAAVATTFEAAARAGMLSVERTAATMPLEVLQREDEADRVRREWRIDGLRAGAFRVLLNMLNALTGFAPSIDELRLRSLGQSDAAVGRDELLATPYPTSSIAPPFDIQVRRSVEDADEPVIRIEFVDRVDPARLPSMATRFAIWDALVLRCGYRPNFEDRLAPAAVDELVAAQQTYLASARVVEHVLYEYVGPPHAFSALVNMCHRLDGLPAVAMFEVE